MYYKFLVLNAICERIEKESGADLDVNPNMAVTFTNDDDVKVTVRISDLYDERDNLMLEILKDYQIEVESNEGPIFARYTAHD